jgi:hypothetical protein
MAMIVKPVKHFNTQAEKRQRIIYVSLEALHFYFYELYDAAKIVLFTV